jgi:hypothetical protein
MSRIVVVIWIHRPPLWSSSQDSWLQIHRSGFDYRHYQIFWEVVGLERGPLSFVSKTEELLGRKSRGSGLENRDYSRRDTSRWPRDTPLSSKAGTSFADKRHSVGIVRSRTKATELFLLLIILLLLLLLLLLSYEYTIVTNLQILCCLIQLA